MAISKLAYNIIILSLCLLLNLPALAQVDRKPIMPDSLTKIFNLKSKNTGRDYMISVRMPQVPDTVGKKFPVVYVLDANSNFDLAARSAQLLALGKEMPPVIIVGIGYMIEDSLGGMSKMMQLRAMDLVPPANEAGKVNRAPALLTRPGEADKFLAFINQELKPFLADQFPVDAKDQTVVGHSFGGIFALYALFTSPNTFNRYIVASPSLPLGKQYFNNLESDFAKTSLQYKGNVFFTVGENEGMMVTDLNQFYDLLKSRNYPNLKIGKQVFADESHMSVIAVAINRGLREIFK